MLRAASSAAISINLEGVPSAPIPIILSPPGDPTSPFIAPATANETSSHNKATSSRFYPPDITYDLLPITLCPGSYLAIRLRIRNC